MIHSDTATNARRQRRQLSLMACLHHHKYFTSHASLARPIHNKPSIMDAPYVDFFVRQEGPDAAPIGSATRNLAFFTGHFGFFLFNAINFLYLVLFEWYAFRRLPQNNLLRLTFCAVVMQLFSCYASITRFNTNDEYGWYAHMGVFTGVPAYVFMNIPYLYLIFPRSSKALYFGHIFWVGFGIVITALSYATWEENKFDTFRKIIGFSEVSQSIILIMFLLRLKSGANTVDTAIISKDNMTRMVEVMAVFTPLAFLMKMFIGMPVLQYPLSGASFSVAVVLMSFVGRMDFDARTDYGRLPQEGNSLVTS